MNYKESAQIVNYLNERTIGPLLTAIGDQLKLYHDRDDLYWYDGISVNESVDDPTYIRIPDSDYFVDKKMICWERSGHLLKLTLPKRREELLPETVRLVLDSTTITRILDHCGVPTHLYGVKCDSYRKNFLFDSRDDYYFEEFYYIKNGIVENKKTRMTWFTYFEHLLMIMMLLENRGLDTHLSHEIVRLAYDKYRLSDSLIYL